jgi:hypothetical protein
MLLEQVKTPTFVGMTEKINQDIFAGLRRFEGGRRGSEKD